MTRTRIALFTAVALFALGADCPGPADLDEGWLVGNGLELHPGVLPATVSADTDAMPFAEAAVAWWEEQLDCAVFELDLEGNGDVFITTGLVPASTEDIDSGGEPLGLAELDFAEDGAILGGTITISSDITYDEDTATQVARHELGHCLGLADDPGPPTTVDLMSVMASPLDPLGELTDGDAQRLEPYLEWCR